MDEDASRLFEEDRKRFLTIFNEFLANERVLLADRRQAVRHTIEVLRQCADLAGFHHD